MQEKGRDEGNENERIKSRLLESLIDKIEKYEAMEGEHEGHIEEERVGWDQLDLSKFLVYGAFISSFCEGTVYPFDLMKTRLQMQGTSYAQYSHYGSLRHAFKTIWRTEGLRGFYRGVHVTVTGTIPCDVLYYGSYESSRHYMRQAYQAFEESSNGKAPPFYLVAPLFNFASGAIAEVTSSIFWVPTDIVAQKLMVQGDLTMERKGVVGIVSQVLKTDGIRGIYRGYVPTICCFAWHSACNFTAYEFARKKLYANYPQGGIIKYLFSTINPDQKNTQNERTPIQKNFIHLLAGTFSGGCAGALSTPVDVVKTRLQVQNYYSKGGDAATEHLKPKHTKFFPMMTSIVRQEGLVGLTKGMAPRVLHSAPNAALTFFMYEFVKQKCKFGES
mmetsp:Transcript_2033/g.3176  ORF Transcript_2033/g.3176 Transcript_2033/m.3176 type:complete len:388 (-) Transcript_2033:527-1690(-)|eukprot:CAMPEP_0201508404 /NCGR_PEP_ID=MMETSP0161_2-20130828/1784_1 /ASSEMBLY_ACC=CAM_ASM_000251 /TAXON_ID=180227 /ORGANISM="Neoparamoeba aestuarina, Strain SoJaBio B1-5/56/2" /LENGTH=387 /DNA_ID=CAMNT_0047903057 /DNA_START=60 /DNA_END=1223 /DNA_ORIENTATION=+